ncbi:ExeM/NucH family extracellular endonuclease [Actinomadura sp. NPDC047616]|uniref:ExeM/NucH family extracellular endonuclease n=1 Tax=Actinomadura sp. NPDC047616 TaxID=3155914 RepID=UPI0034070841
MLRTPTARVAAAAVSAALLAGGLVALGATSAQAAPGDVVISTVYGGGGNSGAPFTHDYVELFNRGSASVELGGWSVQYASATGTGTFASNKVDVTGTLAPGQYLLIRMSGGTTGSPLPAPDVTGSPALSATAGKVALVRSTQGLACNGGSAPCDATQRAQIADLVGYGNAGFYEGGGAAPATSNTTAAVRGSGGCADTDDNAADFSAAAPTPRNSATPKAPCGSTPDPDPEPRPDCTTPASHKISQVQGSGDSTPLAGRTVRVEGVVTGDFQRGDQLGGFYLQDTAPDGDPATSEGLFAYAGTSVTDVKVGDRVFVTGRAVEFNGLTELSPVTSVDVCGTGTVEPTAYDLARGDGTKLEHLENMLVTFPEKLTATEHYQLGRYGEVTVSAGGRLYQPTDRPGVTQAGNDRRRLLIDDGSNVQNPPAVPFTSPEALRLGDTVTGLTGVLTYGFSKYRLQPTRPVAFRRDNPRPAAPAPVGAANVKVASFNTLNWFTTLDQRGADTAQEQERQLTKLVAALKGLDADVVGLMEVENNSDTAVKALVDRLNAAVGAGTYAWGRNPNPGTDAIHVALIYRPAKVRPVGQAVSSEDAVFERPPLAQTFRRVGGGEPFTVIVNHFKSKSCGDATGPDADQGDGQGCWNARRVRQAQAVAALAGSVPHPLVIGDLNSYGEEDPIKTLRAAGLASQTERFVPAAGRYSYVFDGQAGELDHVLAARSLAKRVTGATIWHINSDEPTILDYNTEYNPPSLYRPDAFRASDHDPVLIGLRMH